MAQIKDIMALELEIVLRDAAVALTLDHIKALLNHPDAVRSSLAAAAEALSSKQGGRSHGQAVGSGTAGGTRLVGREEAGRRSPTNTPGGPEDLLTSDQLASRVGLRSRGSVHDWLRKGRIIGWSGMKRGFVFPAGQLDGQGRLLEGIEQVAGRFKDGYAAWVWLSTPLPSLGGKRPLSLLEKGDTASVAAALDPGGAGESA